MSRDRRHLATTWASAGERNEQGIGLVEKIMLEAMRFKHDHHLQRLGAGTGNLGHVALLDPGNKNLRATGLNGQTRFEADP
jgi:hypothetical protein